MTICIYGAASNKIADKYKERVEALGEEIAMQGHSIVYGAGGCGLMGACARGVKNMGGEVIGVAPRFMHDIEEIYEDCTELIETDTMAERKEIMEEKADAFVIVPGGIGTYDEFFQVLTLKQLGVHDKPIVLYNVDGYYDMLQDVIRDGIEKGFIAEDVADLYVACDTAEEVLYAAEDCHEFEDLDCER